MMIVISKKNLATFTETMTTASAEAEKKNNKRATLTTAITAGSSVAATAAAAVITNVITAKKLKRATAETKANIESMNTNMEVCLSTMAKKAGYSLAEEVSKFLKEQDAEEKKEEKEKTEEEKKNNQK